MQSQQKPLLNNVIERVKLHRPMSIYADKAPTYRKVIRETNNRYDSHCDHITHIDRKCLINRIESDHATLKWLFGCRQSF